MDVQLPDGTLIKGVPEGTSKAQLAEKLQANGRQVPQEWLTPTSAPTAAPRGMSTGTIRRPLAVNPGSPGEVASTALNTLGMAPVGSAEAIASIGSGAAATPLAGLAGLLGGGAEGVRGVQDALTYQPRTESGQIQTQALTAPLSLAAQGANKVGEKTAEVTHSPFVGALANTALQAIPALLTRGRAAAPEAAAEAAAKAEAFVRDRTGLDWNSLSGQIKDQITAIAHDAKALDNLDPKAVERQALLQSLPEKIPATHGQLTRNAAELRNEGNVSATSAGQPIRDIHIAQNEALLKNLDVLKGRVSGSGETAATATTPEQVGTSVQDFALRAKAAASKSNYDALYKKARNTEPNASVSADPFYSMLESSPEVQHLGFLDSWLKRSKVSKTESTDGITVTSKRPLTMAELSDLRVKANDIARTGGVDGYYAGKVREAIDQSMQDVPAAARAWKEANNAFKAHKLEFDEQGAVAKLVENKSRTDRSVALEDTVKSIRTGSLEDIEAIKRSLLTGGNNLTRMAGRKALRDVRAQIIQDIKDQATKSVQVDERGNANLTPAALQRAINSYGAPKLDSIFGPGVTKHLNKILEAAKLTKTEPPVQVPGSSSVANALSFLERNLGRLPLVGDLAAGSIKAGIKLNELGANSRAAQAATQSPLDTGAAAFARYAKNQNALRNLRAGVATNALASQERP